ncbi:MAG TPA: hypothetical protein PKD90_00870 [Phnomibacter sp.]|nr:hypothetical protein [Phnomibacter sp.]
MAKSLYDIRNYPIRGGTSQRMRYSATLMGQQVALDERTLQDFIGWAGKLGKYLTYYNNSGEKEGTWEHWLQQDVSWHLAKAINERSNHWRTLWNELMEPVTPATEPALQQVLAHRFQALYTMVANLMETYAASAQMQPWHMQWLATLTTQQIAVSWFMLEAYYVACSSLLPAEVNLYKFQEITLDTVEKAKQRIDTYSLTQPGVLQLAPVLFDDPSFFFGTAATVAQKIAAASEYLNELAIQFIGLMEANNQLAEKYLQQSLTSLGNHQPHVGLFYAFLQVSQIQQTAINDLLLQHLDFYYRQVLQCQERSWKAPQAVVCFELAKNISSHFIEEGTLLNAGKDSGGKMVSFATSESIVVNKATVEQIMSSTYIANQPGMPVNVRQPAGVFAMPQANSANGFGAALTPGQSWHPFAAQALPPAPSGGIGLAFYAPLLKEATGIEKSFTLEVAFANNQVITQQAVQVLALHGALKIFTNDDNNPLYIPLTNLQKQGNGFKISFTLSEETKLTSKEGPNASIIVGHKSGTVDDIFSGVVGLFQTASIVSLVLTFQHSAVEVNHVETAAGITDASSAFPAFGGLPKVGSFFHVYVPLLKQRTVHKLWMDITWTSNTEEQQQWEVSYPGQPAQSISLSANAQASELRLITGSNQYFGNQATIKCTLKNSLGHTNYAKDYTKTVLQVMQMPNYGIMGIQQKNLPIIERNDFYDNIFSKYEKVLGDAVTNLPAPPFNPVIKKITLNAVISERVDAQNAQAIKLYHQSPFGYKAISVFNQARLMPPLSHEGELYLGIANLNAGDALHILIQVEEGSANPALDTPLVSWQLLHGNTWLDFDKQLFTDGTRGLTQSGILRLVWPNLPTAQITLLPAGLHWLKAAVPYNQTAAVCRIVGIHTQAVQAQFINQQNHQPWLGTNLPANTISKLVVGQPQIKKVLQPYATSGGRMSEAASDFYTRTAERLRHKKRAVTIWDLEHLILEQFAEVYKVKVLNHAWYNPATSAVKARPGFVLVLPVAATYGMQEVIKPLISKALLLQIEQFIKPLINGFAQIKVMNPLFEEVEVTTELIFKPHIKDQVYYLQLLKRDINQFLSPWAFGNEQEPLFGGTIYQSVLIDFLEELPYVDAVIQASLRHQGSPNPQQARASSPASVLIPATQHFITAHLAGAHLINT